MVSSNRYSHHARRALQHAGTLVARYRHTAVDTGHLLVGIMLTEGSIGCTVLQTMGLTPARAIPLLQTLYPMIDMPGSETAPADALDQALALAADESVWLGQHYIGTEHLLLGLTRTNAGSASLLLARMDSSADRVRRQVRRLLREGVTAEFNLHLARRTARLSELSRRVITGAEQMAVALDHPTVGIGHLLLVLLLEERSPIAAVLRASGLDEIRLRAGLDARDPLLLVSVETVLMRVVDHAENMGSHYTGTEHLMLALVTTAAGTALLHAYNVDAEALRVRLQQVFH